MFLSISLLRVSLVPPPRIASSVPPGVQDKGRELERGKGGPSAQAKSPQPKAPEGACRFEGWCERENVDRGFWKAGNRALGS